MCRSVWDLSGIYLVEDSRLKKKWKSCDSSRIDQPTFYTQLSSTMPVEVVPSPPSTFVSLWPSSSPHVFGGIRKFPHPTVERVALAMPSPGTIRLSQAVTLSHFMILMQKPWKHNKTIYNTSNPASSGDASINVFRFSMSMASSCLFQKQATKPSQFHNCI